MKLKLKCDSQEKDISDKNEKIKSISAQVIEFQKKSVDIAYLREEIQTLETKIKLHEGTIQALSKDN
jgi:predicted RNase H-like nuclease (RuvC/YqgF family)